MDKAFGKSPTCQRATNLSEFIANQSRFYVSKACVLEHEANVKTALLEIRMMACLSQLTFPSAPIQISLSANPNQLKTERSENNLRLCGEKWLTNSNFSSLMQMNKVYSSLPHSILDPKSSASKIEETELDSLFSSLLHLVVDKRLHLLHLMSVPSISPEVFQRVLSQVDKDSCVRAAPSPLRFFAAWRPAAILSFPGSMGPTPFVLFDRGVTMHESSSCSRVDALGDSGRPCDPYLVFF